jgi:hypothetical protein
VRNVYRSVTNEPAHLLTKPYISSPANVGLPNAMSLKVIQKKRPKPSSVWDAPTLYKSDTSASSARTSQCLVCGLRRPLWISVAFGSEIFSADAIADTVSATPPSEAKYPPEGSGRREPAGIGGEAGVEMYFGRFYGIDDLIGLSEKATSEELLTQAQEFFQGEAIAVTVLGNLNGLKLSGNQLAC